MNDDYASLVASRTSRTVLTSSALLFQKQVFSMVRNSAKSSSHSHWQTATTICIHYFTPSLSFHPPLLGGKEEQTSAGRMSFGPTCVAHTPPLKGWHNRDSLCYGVWVRVWRAGVWCVLRVGVWCIYKMSKKQKKRPETHPQRPKHYSGIESIELSNHRIKPGECHKNTRPHAWFRFSSSRQ